MCCKDFSYFFVKISISLRIRNETHAVISGFTGREGTVKKRMKCPQAISHDSWLKLTDVSGTMPPSLGTESCTS
jgi:hypothetical protein